LLDCWYILELLLVASLECFDTIGCVTGKTSSLKEIKMDRLNKK